MPSFSPLRVFALPFILAAMNPSLEAQDSAGQRKPWAEVSAPAFVSLAIKTGDPRKIVASFDLVTSTDGADRAVVDMTDEQGRLVESRTVGKTKADRKTAEFIPARSGRYAFRVIASRTNVAETKESATRIIDFALPLGTPEASARNLGGGRLRIDWAAVPEASGYEVGRLDEGPAASITVLASTTANSCELAGLEPGSVARLTVTAVRGDERVSSRPLLKTIRLDADRTWNFTWFGQSSGGAVNTFAMLDADSLEFRLGSCTTQANGQIDQKGGKFTAFHDGISFYYTEIDPAKENFVLEATFTVDFINPTADGQEGFGLLAMDKLGSHGVSAVNHYTNSAGIIATKFEETSGGTKKTSKDTLGARFVSGITPSVLAMGDTGIARYGRSESRAFSYEASALIRQGKSYRLTLRKTNTGYHAAYRDPAAPEGGPAEFTMFGPDKLMQLDPDRLYLGFAAARGCNVTVSDVKLAISDVATDPAGAEEPPELVPLSMRVQSPQTWTEKEYPLVFTANADGRLTVSDDQGTVLAKDALVKAGEDFVRTFSLRTGSMVFTLRFTPDPLFKPGPGQAIAVWNPALQAYAEDYGVRTVDYRVYRKSFGRKELFASPRGSSLGDGSEAKPLDLAIALAFAKRGQPVILLPGTYYPALPVVIERGNDGTAGSPKTLRSAPGGRAILDFSRADGGMQVWGDHWIIEGIDIRNTPGNAKGLQIGGSDCVVKDVATYFCGDTGLQISGNGPEPFAKWPRDNLVLNCLSHDNADPAANNADGFAAKLTCGPGNAFRGCIAYSNIDDGWDLFSKIESGPIGEVLIEGCVAYRNGSLSDGSGNGDGNGFKLGGDGIAVAHVIRDSLAYGNGASGITSNSDPAVIVENCTSFGNKGSNINLYGKGDGKRSFEVRNVISLKGGAADVYREMPELASADNYFWNGAQSVNSEGRLLTSDMFANADQATVPARRPDGSIDLKGFMIPGPDIPAGSGAKAFR